MRWAKQIEREPVDKRSSPSTRGRWHAMLRQVDRNAQPDGARANDDHGVTDGGGRVLVFRPPIWVDSLLIAHRLPSVLECLPHLSVSVGSPDAGFGVVSDLVVTTGMSNGMQWSKITTDRNEVGDSPTSRNRSPSATCPRPRGPHRLVSILNEASRPGDPVGDLWRRAQRCPSARNECDGIQRGDLIPAYETTG